MAALPRLRRIRRVLQFGTAVPVVRLQATEQSNLRLDKDELAEQLPEDYFPVPLRDDVIGFGTTLFETCSVAPRVPVAIGLNVTLIVQDVSGQG